MMGGYLSLAVELGVLMLLAVTLWRAARLERALRVLRGERGALMEAMQGFQESANLAEQGAAKLRGLTEGACRGLTVRVGDAETLQSDLAYMIERGVALADRLEAIVRDARRSTGVAAMAGPEAAPLPDMMVDNRERRMLRALGLGR